MSGKFWEKDILFKPWWTSLSILQKFSDLFSTQDTKSEFFSDAYDLFLENWYVFFIHKKRFFRKYSVANSSEMWWGKEQKN